MSTYYAHLPSRKPFAERRLWLLQRRFCPPPAPHARILSLDVLGHQVVAHCQDIRLLPHDFANVVQGEGSNVDSVRPASGVSGCRHERRTGGIIGRSFSGYACDSGAGGGLHGDEGAQDEHVRT